MKKLLFLLMIMLSSSFVLGCDNNDNDGPLENIAEDIDEAVDELD